MIFYLNIFTAASMGAHLNTPSSLRQQQHRTMTNGKRRVLQPSQPISQVSQNTEHVSWRIRRKRGSRERKEGHYCCTISSSSFLVLTAALLWLSIFAPKSYSFSTTTSHGSSMICRRKSRNSFSIRLYNNNRVKSTELFGMNDDGEDDDLDAVFDEEGDDDEDGMNEKKNVGANEEELQRQIEQQQKQIDQLLAMMKSQQQQQQSQPPPRFEPPPSPRPTTEEPEQPPTRRRYSVPPPPPPIRSSSPTSVRDFSSRTTNPSPRATSRDRDMRWSPPPTITTPPQSSSSSLGLATASMSPLSAMLFIDGTWLYYSIYEREFRECPIAQKYGRFWKNQYYFDWAALPRVICTALHQQNSGWAVTSRPVEIVRASVFTSYKADTSPASFRFRMYQEMSNANYDVHMMTTVGKSEKCVDINIAVEMLHLCHRFPMPMMLPYC